MIDQDQAIVDAREAADATPADRLIERLAELIGAKAGVRAVFGEPVQQGGVTDPGCPRSLGVRWRGRPLRGRAGRPRVRLGRRRGCRRGPDRLCRHRIRRSHVPPDPRAISEPGIPDRVRADRCDRHSSACSADSALTTARASSR